MRSTRTILLLGVAVLLAAGTASAQVDTSKYVAVGDSLTAGYASGGLAKYYQDYSFPKILAGQFGATNFQQPTISDPGITAVYELKKLSVVNGSIVPTIAPKSGLGQPINATYQGIYNNLGIPGAKTNDLLTKKGDITKLLTGQIDPNTIMYDIVLRDNTNEAYKQAIGAQGTFYTVWIGNNDVLGAALAGIALEGVTLTPKADFQTQYTTLLGAIHSQRPNAKIVVATVPDVTAIPFVTTVKPYLVNPSTGGHIPLIGQAGLLTEQDYLTLGASSLLAQGIGIPTAAGGTGLPLPEGSIDQTGLHAGVILRAAEVAAIKARTAELNTIIKSVAQGVGAQVLDVNAFFNEIQAHGYVVGGIKLTPSFLTGGLFSYDGVHPQRLGYAILANELVKLINASLGGSIPEVDLKPYLLGAQAATTVQAGETVFSLEAYRSLLAVMVPQAITADIGAPRHVVRPRLDREVDGPDKIEVQNP